LSVVVEGRLRKNFHARKKTDHKNFQSQKKSRSKVFKPEKFRPQKFSGAKSVKIENRKMGLFFEAGAISRFRDPMKNLDRENFRLKKF